MMCKSRLKFKERLVLVSVGAFFTIILVAETQFLSYITPKSTTHTVKHTTRDTLTHTDTPTDSTKIFEQVLQNINNHIGVMRRALAFTDTGNNRKPINTHTNQLKEVLATSKVVYKYAKLFQQIADILTNSSATRNSSRHHNEKQLAKKNAGITHKLRHDYNTTGAHGRHEGWPTVNFHGNTDPVSRQQANGYMKRKAHPVILTSKELDDLQMISKYLKKRHRKRDTALWDTLGLYDNEK